MVKASFPRLLLSLRGRRGADTVLRTFTWLGCLLLLAATAWSRPLLVISIDGLDHRYMRDRDALGLKIPNLRRLVLEGSWADKGVIGVWPTVTFPSHTTIVTGIRPDQHGIINNNRPRSEGGERYFFASFLKVPTLWDAAHKAGMRTAAIHWPVTVDSKTIDWDFPEHFKRRRGAGMDWDSTAEKATPGLIDKMIAKYPAMPQEWVDDRIRTLATLYLLKHEKPDLVLLHLIDHDSEAHDTGPFSRQAKAVLEYQDELLGQILAAKPRDMVVALVSDHGFERVDEAVNIWTLLKQAGVNGKFETSGTLLWTNDDSVATFLRKSDVTREIPVEEWKRFTPHRPVPRAAFEPKPHTIFANSPDAPARAKILHGEHGFWPLRADYRSTFLLWGKGIRPTRLGELDMLSIASRLAEVLNLPFGKDRK